MYLARQPQQIYQNTQMAAKELINCQAMIRRAFTQESSVMFASVTPPIPANARLVLAKDTKSKRYTVSLEFPSTQVVLPIEEFDLEEESRAIVAFNLYANAVRTDNGKFSYNSETKSLDFFIQVDSNYLRLISDNMADL
ncbi:hypothetical protein HY501_01925 [Candidatus Woesearchaeota archaeon]|nr:hypothetical protein [Candidatus Woesearchaeota archaeon]